MTANAPTPEARADLLQEIGPLPLNGQAWPDWVRILTWIILAIIGVQLLNSAIELPPGRVNMPLAAAVALGFLGLGLVSWHMQVSITTIDQRGLHQSWFTRREVAWEDIRSARFMPWLFSKRLVIITRQGRPVIFQGGTRELQAAFDKISRLYRPGA